MHLYHCVLFMSSTKALASTLSLRAHDKLQGRRARIVLFIKELMEIEEGKICLRPLAMNSLRAQAGSPQDFSAPHIHPGHGKEEAFGEDMLNEGME